MAYQAVTVHYPDGSEFDFYVNTTASRLVRLGEKYKINSGVYTSSELYANSKQSPIKDSYFLTVEVSEDKQDVWVDFIDVIDNS